MFKDVGNSVRDAILSCADLLKEESTPGLVAAALFLACGVAIILFANSMFQRRKSLRAVISQIDSQDADQFSTAGFDNVSKWLQDDLKVSKRVGDHLREAWAEFGETLSTDTRFDPPVRCNTVRPAFFFNIEDLGFGPGFYRILPGLFVSIGLALTFLGLIAVLQGMQQITDETMLTLLDLASAKFIMSLSGLSCSIIMTIGLRVGIGSVEEEIHRLVRKLERHFDFVSLETLALEQLKVQKDAQEANKKLAFELVAELGRPLREELPQAIATSIRENFAPVIEKISQQGTDSVSSMAGDLSRQLTSGIGEALATASASMAQAGDRLAQLADRMDNSSGRMGAEMESAVARVAQAVDDLRGAMASTAEQTGGAFTQGADHLLAVMNRTLEAIRDNTGESSRAMSAAAEEMTRAAHTMKEEMEGAARAGSEAARGRMQAAGDEVSEAIASAGVSISGTYEAAAGRIAELARSLSDRTGEDLLVPLRDIESQLKSMVATLDDGVRRMQGFASAVGDGAQAGNAAADSFRGAARDLVEATGPMRSTVEQIGRSTQAMNEGIERATTAVMKSSEEVAQSSARTLQAAGETIGSEQRSIATVVTSIEALVREMKGQGDRIDDIDAKLGRAFELYSSRTETSMQSIRTHVTEMASELNGALDSLRAIVDSLQDFTPQQRTGSY